MKKLYIILVILFTLSCSEKPIEPLLPPDTSELNDSQQVKMNGVYFVRSGKNIFGDTIVARWVNDSFVFYSTSDVIFAENFGGINKIFSDNKAIILNGYVLTIRRGTRINLELFVNEIETGNIFQNQYSSLIIRGISSGGDSIQLRKVRELYNGKDSMPRFILAHRGGGRNTERLGYSENSLELMKFSEKLGATGIEIDIMSTKDRVPIIFHDPTFSPRTVRGAYLLGKVNNFTLLQIKEFGQLIYGEKIPTLEETLKEIIDETNLQLIWLDMKAPEIMNEVINVLQDAIIYSKSQRSIIILLGMPDDATYKSYNLSTYNLKENKPPILIEYSYASALYDENCRAWGPRWTDGIDDPNIREVQKNNKFVFAWTVDMTEYINEFFYKKKVNGILTNYPCLVAAKYWSRVK
jgi:glycerophosphoryl diester phosphodiesterase